MEAKVAPELIPKRAFNTATASSKKFETAIIQPGQEIEYFCPKSFIKKAVKSILIESTNEEIIKVKIREFSSTEKEKFV